MARMTQAQHTATPWSRNISPASKYPVIFAGRNTHVAQVVTRGLSDEEIEGNCDFIVRAVNSHTKLVEALKCALTEIHNPGAMSHQGIDILEMIDSALALAKES